MRSICWMTLLTVGLLACQTDSHEKLFAEYYAPLQLQLYPENNVVEPGLAEGAAAYQAGDYEKVVQITETYLATGYPIPQVMMAQSMAYIETKRDDAALRNLKILQDYPLYQDVARWYQALVHLRAGRLAEAQPLLQWIAGSTSSDYLDKSKQLLERIAP